MKQKILLNIITSLFLCFILSSVYSGRVLAATILLTPDKQTISQNDIISISVDEDSGTDPVNTVQFSVTFPSSSFSSVTTDAMNSAFAIQAENIQQAGIVKIARGSITPVRGRQHITTITFKANTSVLLQSIIVQPDALIIRSSDHRNIFTSSMSSGTFQTRQSTQTQTNLNKNSYNNTAQQQTQTEQPSNETIQNSGSSDNPTMVIPSNIFITPTPSKPSILTTIANFIFGIIFGRK